MSKAFVILFFSTSIVTTSFAQEIPVKTQQQLESLADATEDETQQDDSYLLQLDYVRKNPIDLNIATAGELQSLRLITDLQINNLIKYRNLLGRLIDIYELQAVPTWDINTINKLLPYVTLSSAIPVKENFISRFRNGDKTLLFRISRVVEKSKGYNTTLQNHYLGDRNHVLLRYRYQYKDVLQYGFVTDKDAGEQFFKGAQSTGFDFYSFHLFARRLGRIVSLAIGDYTVNLGQGLIQWQSLGFGKSAEIMGVKRQSPILLPYRSAGEFNFNRGVGVTIKIRNLETTGFVSYKKFSGNIIDTLNGFSSFLNSGLHRTSSEIADRNAIGDFSAGGNITYQSTSFKVGINTVTHQFSKALQKSDAPYNHYMFRGKTLWNGSVDYSYTYKNVHLFGEAAFDKSFNRAFINGALISVDPKVDVFILHRFFGKQYQSLFGNAFAENTLPLNEAGTYAGIAIRPVTGWALNAYVDFFKSPWLRYRTDAPSNGTDCLVQLEYNPNKQSQIYILYKTKAKPLNQSGSITNFLVDRARQNLRLHMVTQINPSFIVKARTEIMWYDKGRDDAEDGFLGFVEGSYRYKRWHMDLRLQYFETADYNSRIYAYENDVPYSFSVPAFFNKGFRYYANLNYDISNGFNLWLRWAQTVYKGIDKIGSGLDEIDGNHRSELKLQLFLSF